MLMLTEIEGNDWEVLLKPAKRIKVGNKLNFGNGKIIAECIKENGSRWTHHAFYIMKVFYKKD